MGGRISSGSIPPLHRSTGRWGIPGLLPLSQWDPDDEAELRSLLDAAEKQ